MQQFFSARLTPVRVKANRSISRPIRLTAPVALTLLACLAWPAAAAVDEVKEINDMTEARRHFQAGSAAFIKGDLKGAIKEMDLALSLEKDTRTKAGQTPFDTSYNAAKSQIRHVGSCMRGLAYTNLEGGIEAAARDMAQVYGKGAVCAEFRETPVSTLGVAGQASKDELVQFCEMCVAQAPFFIGYDEHEKGAVEKALRHMTEYLSSKDDTYREQALDVRGAAFITLKNWKSAIKDYEVLVKLDPKNADSRAVLGSIKLRQYEAEGGKSRELLVSADKDLAASLALNPGGEFAQEQKMLAEKLMRGGASSGKGPK